MVPGAGFEPARSSRPEGFYASPGISPRRGLSLHPRGVPGARRRGLLLGLTPLVSAPSAEPMPSAAWLRITVPRAGRGLGFPEFTRFFTRALPRGRPSLESPVSTSSTIRARGEDSAPSVQEGRHAGRLGTSRGEQIPPGEPENISRFCKACRSRTCSRCSRGRCCPFGVWHGDCCHTIPTAMRFRERLDTRTARTMSSS